MKKSIKILSAVLSVCLTIFSLPSCNIPTDKSKKEPNPFLSFTLSPVDVKQVRSKLEECKKATLEGYNPRKIERLWEEYARLLEHVETQERVATISYYANMNSSVAKSNNSYASNAYSTLHSEYLLAVQEIYRSDSPYRDEFFSDWSEEDIRFMLADFEELKRLNESSRTLIDEYYELSKRQLEEKIDGLYTKVISVNNAIAKEYGYPNYYEYAHDNVYRRDYDLQQTENFRNNVAEYLVPALFESQKDFYTAQSELSMNDLQFCNDFFSKNYKNLAQDYLAEYIENSPDPMKHAFSDALDSKAVLFATSSSAFEGAFCTYLPEYGTPFCYFGPGYQTGLSVVHELGHYYAALHQDLAEQSFDLAETQSQSNEWFFIGYLQNRLPKQTARALTAMQTYAALANIVTSTLVDDFEYTVYTRQAELLTSDPQTENVILDFDKIFEEVCQEYGGIEKLSKILDLQGYWKQVVVANPVYYISYAVSGLASINLYQKAIINKEDALTSYIYLVEEAEPSNFLLSLSAANITSPFDNASFIPYGYQPITPKN